MSPCKLCEAETRFRFAGTVLGRHRCEYFECVACGSLQVPDAPWLPEAYRDARWPLDTGLVTRNLLLAAKVAAFLDGCVARTETIVDFGGGTGLLTRLLRDMGWNVLCHDRYRKPVFVEAFHIERIDPPSARVVIASEVIEHLDTPRETLGEILDCARLVLFTTELYSGQGDDWWYLAPDSGQHIFFPTQRALEAFAGPRGFDLVNAGFVKFLIHRDFAAEPAALARINSLLKDAAINPVSDLALFQLVRHLLNPWARVDADHQRELEAASRTRP